MLLLESFSLCLTPHPLCPSCCGCLALTLPSVSRGHHMGCPFPLWPTPAAEFISLPPLPHHAPAKSQWSPWEQGLCHVLSLRLLSPIQGSLPTWRRDQSAVS